MGDISTHFSRSEFRCKCGQCYQDTVDAELLSILETIRDHYERKVTITSGNRCRKHNTNVGGGKKSQHLLSRAADIVVEDTAPADVQDYIDQEFPNQFGLGRYDDFTHVDSRKDFARWTG